jgi:2-dehydro-3-deoxyphosphogluconate aldolase/(4S)-4-hydroxy-2-oxoglutarate aldolase
MTIETHVSFADVFRRTMILAILRGLDSRSALRAAEALADGGIVLLEVALTGRESLSQITLLARELGDRVIIGAGTVTSQPLAEAATEAGARFLVTPHLVPAVNAFGRERGMEVLGGALTPTEIAASRSQGNTFIKVFPAVPLGPSFLSALRGPYPDTELVPVGGVDASNAEEFIRAGAVGVGVGGALTKRQGDSFEPSVVAAMARELRAAVERGREARV